MTPSPTRPAPRRRLFGLLAMIGVAILWGSIFIRVRDDEAEPFASPLIGKPAPALTLDPLPGSGPLGDLSAGHVTVLNLFGSWCGPCRAEHRQLMALAGELGGVEVAGVAVRDSPAAAAAFLRGSGNPFARGGVDRDGATAAAWRVAGVPQTFVVRGDGVVIANFVGPLGERSRAEVARLALAAAH